MIKLKIKDSLEMYFNLVKDTRNQSYITYKLSDVLFLLVCGMLCGCKELEEIVELGEERFDFFKKHSSLEQIPCVTTIINILSIVKAERLELCLQGIVRNVFNSKTKYKQICIDGKTISSRLPEEYKDSIHVVTAMLADNYLSIGQKVIDHKKGEIKAVRELIDEINIKDAVVTMDALHCQKETVAKIIKNKGDYVVQLKANQANFYEDVYTMFDDKYMDKADKNCEYETYTTIDKGHGRIEKRTCYVLNDVAYFTDYLDNWKGLKKIFAVKREVEVKGKKSIEISCYLSSKNSNAEELLSYTRKHWQIESFHWLLDVNLGEDNSRILNQKVQICLNIVRKFSISIIKKYIESHEVKRKTIISNMRKCLMNPKYLESILDYYCNSLDNMS